MAEQPDCAYYKVYYTEKAWLKQKTFNDGYLKVAGRRNGELFDVYFKGLARTSNLEMNINDRQESECNITGGKNKYLIVVDKQIDLQLWESLRSVIKSIPVQTKGVIAPGAGDSHGGQQSQQKQKPVEEEGVGGFVLCDVGTIGIKSKCWLEKNFAESLHPHQFETAQSIFNTLAGLAPPNTIGGQSKALILDDEPGLGKKIALIGVLRTILYQSPYKKNEPLVNKVLILTPEDRLNQWVQEINEWIGEKKLSINVLSSKAPREEGQKQVQKFENKFQKLMVASYEAIVVFKTYFTTRLDLMIWDDVPRLLPLMRVKSQLESFNSWDVRKKLIISSKPVFPVHACLPEIFATLSLVSVDGCKSEKTFKKTYAEPILKSKSPNATADEVEAGNKKISELERILNGAIMKRTISELPIGSCIREEVMFVRPTQEQINSYNQFLPELNRKLNAGQWGGDIRVTIGKMSQVLIHPDIILPKKPKGPEEESSEEEDDFDASSDRKIRASGKMGIINDLVDRIVVSPEKYGTVVSKLIIISEQRPSLDFVRKYLLHRRINYCWIDHETSPFKAKKFAEKFTESNDTKVMLVLGGAVQPKLMFPPGSTVVLLEPYLDSASPGLNRGRCLFAARRTPLPPTRFLRLVSCDSAELILLAYEQSLWSFSTEEDKPPTLAIPEDQLACLIEPIKPDNINNFPQEPVVFQVAKSMCKPCKAEAPQEPVQSDNTAGEQERQIENVEQILAEMEGNDQSATLTKIIGEDNIETAGNSENIAPPQEEYIPQQPCSIQDETALKSSDFTAELNECQATMVESEPPKLQPFPEVTELSSEPIIHDEFEPILEVVTESAHQPLTEPVQKSPRRKKEPEPVLPGWQSATSLSRVLESDSTPYVPCLSGPSAPFVDEDPTDYYQEETILEPVKVATPAQPHFASPAKGSSTSRTTTSDHSPIQENKDPEPMIPSTRVDIRPPVSIKATPLAVSQNRKPNHGDPTTVIVSPPTHASGLSSPPGGKKQLSGWNTPVIQVKPPVALAGQPGSGAPAANTTAGMSLYQAFLKRSLAESSPENGFESATKDLAALPKQSHLPK